MVTTDSKNETECLKALDIFTTFNIVAWNKVSFETKFEYIHPVWNMYLGGFDPETSSSSDSSCPTLNLRGYRDRVSISYSSSEICCDMRSGKLGILRLFPTKIMTRLAQTVACGAIKILVRQGV